MAAMLSGSPLTDTATAPRVNVADRLSLYASQSPDAVAVASVRGAGDRTITFAQLDNDATLLAHSLIAMGVRPGHRLALLVKPGIEFVTLVFAVLRSGATMVLVDSGLGRQNIVRCLESTSPDGFVAIPQGHALRVLLRKKFPRAKLNVTVGRRWFWGGETLASLRKLGQQSSVATQLPATSADDSAAIVFTSGSTGPPKGVIYRHETFVTQCEEIQRHYDLQPGAVDLACFPLFGLFNVACGITTVLPEMDFSRPASCDPKKLFHAANAWKVSQSFASPAVWDRLSRHAELSGERIPTLKKVFSCGAPVPAKVIRRTLAMIHPEAELHTPYGATEALPVATIEAQEILEETATQTDQGAGVCVGKKFDSIQWRVIRITDDPIATIDETEELPTGEIGELIVRGPQVSREYLDSDHHNALAKIKDGNHVWHRMGDVGYFDDQDRFWYCGRKSQRVQHRNGDLFCDQIEAAIGTIPEIAKCALVGYRPFGFIEPALVVELLPGTGRDNDGQQLWKRWRKMNPQIDHLWYGAAPGSSASFTAIPMILIHSKLPTDIRHNSKINRELLADWAAEKLGAKWHTPGYSDTHQSPEICTFDNT